MEHIPMPNDRRAALAIQAFWVFFVMHILLFSSANYLHYVVDNLETFDNISSLSSFLIAIRIAYSANYLIVIILFIRWFRRAYKNLERMGIRIELEEGWAAGGWFVPILNIVRPYEIMSEIWYKTQRNIPNNNQIKGSLIVNAWWILFIIGSILRRTYMIFGNGNLILTITLGMVTLTILLTSLFLLIRIIEQVNQFEERLHRSGEYETDFSEHLISDF